MRVTDQGIERIVSIVLRTGVILSGLIVMCGGIYFLARHGMNPLTITPSEDKHLPAITLLKLFAVLCAGKGDPSFNSAFFA